MSIEIYKKIDDLRASRELRIKDENIDN